MKIGGKPYRTIWPLGVDAVEVIDQTRLPHRFETLALRSAADAAHAIKAMIVRGAPLIGATAGLRHGAGDARGRVRRGARPCA